jgi:hypothetical protein
MGSVDIAISMGQRVDGESAGHLRIRGDVPSSYMAQPRRLRLLADYGDNEILLFRDTLRQVKSPQALADIVTVDNYKYYIRFYDKDHWGTKNYTGYYAPVADTQFATWTIEDPDRSLSSNRLQITRQAGTDCKRWIYRYIPGTGSYAWELDRKSVV